MRIVTDTQHTNFKKQAKTKMIKIMNSKRLVDATIEDLLQALKPAIREEIKDASDLISRAEAQAILGVKPSTMTYYVKNDILIEYNGSFSRSAVLAHKAKLENKAA